MNNICAILAGLAVPSIIFIWVEIIQLRSELRTMLSQLDYSMTVIKNILEENLDKSEKDEEDNHE